MSATKGKYDKFLEELPKHNYNITKTALASGFAKSTAEKQQGRIYKSALKYKAQRALDTLENKTAITKEEGKALMREIVGLSREDLMATLLKIATQDKDYGSALKVLAPLAKEEGVVLHEDDTQKVTVPILNVTVKEKRQLIDMAQPSHETESTTAHVGE